MHTWSQVRSFVCPSFHTLTETLASGDNNNFLSRQSVCKQQFGNYAERDPQTIRNENREAQRQCISLGIALYFLIFPIRCCINIEKATGVENEDDLALVAAVISYRLEVERNSKTYQGISCIGEYISGQI